MKTALKVSGVLSWINIILWGYTVLDGLLAGLANGSALLLTVTFFLSSIVLHSYAAMKLRKSILHPEIPLGSQTPVGIRLIGMAASFLGVLFVLLGLVMITATEKTLTMVKTQSPGPYGDLYKSITIGQMHQMGVLFLLMGLFVTVNVFINSRLLRWYYVKNQRD